MNKLVSTQIEQRLNQHTKWEKESAEIYESMATWCRFNGFNNVAKFFFKHADEERGHGRKIVNYLDEKECLAVIPALEQPDTSGYKSMRSLFEQAYEHEMFVTNTYKELATMALKEGDHDTYGFALMFLAEQREEIDLYSGYLDKLDLLQDGPQSAYLFDHDFDN